MIDRLVILQQFSLLSVHRLQHRPTALSPLGLPLGQNIQVFELGGYKEHGRCVFAGSHTGPWSEFFYGSADVPGDFPGKC